MAAPESEEPQHMDSPLAKQIKEATSADHESLNSTIMRLTKQVITPIEGSDHARELSPRQKENIWHHPRQKLTNPVDYTIGLIPFASIFRSLEQALDRWMAHTHQIPAQNISDFQHKLCQAFKELSSPTFRRTRRFTADVNFLCDRCRTCCAPFESDIEHVHESHAIPVAMCTMWLQHPSAGCIDCEFCSPHTVDLPAFRTIMNRLKDEDLNPPPHYLVAWIWVWYMAVFSGGRYIREILVKTRFTAEWDSPADLKPQDDDPEKYVLRQRLGYSFLFFDPRSHQGASPFSERDPGPEASQQEEDEIKTEFKMKFACFDELLNDDQKMDIVKESKWIFEKTIALVAEISSAVDIGTEGSVPKISAEIERQHG